MKNIITTIAKINEVEILVLEEDESYVPIKPICQLLGVAERSQWKKLKEHPVYSSVVMLRVTTGADGKQYEMFCISYRFVFGWLLSIHPNNVKPEVRDMLISYQIECNNALFDYFTNHANFYVHKQQAFDEIKDEEALALEEVKLAKKKVEEARKKRIKVEALTIDEWQANNRQLTFNFA